MRDWQCPHTGFGDEPNTAIKFGVLRDRSGHNPAWTGGEARLNTFAIRHSNDVVTQYDGRDPRELTVRLRFDDLAALDALDAVQGTAATLRYRWGITSAAGGTMQTIAGVKYLTLPDTLLVRLSDQRTYTDGSAEAVATFRRAYVAPVVRTPTPPYPDPPYPGDVLGERVVFLGDSITAGQSILASNQHRGLSYVTVAWIVSEGRLRFIPGGNAGVNGDDTGEALARLQTDVIDLAPETCVVALGANDALSAKAITYTTDNLTAIVVQLKAAGIKPVLCQMPLTETKVAEMAAINAAIADIASAYAVPLVDLYEAATPSDAWITGGSYDDTHPTRYGAGILAEKLVADLDALGKLDPTAKATVLGSGDARNLLTNGTFEGDANSDGVADGWTGTPTASREFRLVADPAIEGNWQEQEIVTSGTALSMIQLVTTGYSPGDTLAFSGHVEADHVGVPADTSATHIRPSIWLECGGGVTSEGWGTVYVVDALGHDVTGGRFYVETKVPRGTTSYGARITSAASGTGLIRVAQMSLRNLTAEGIAENEYSDVTFGTPLLLVWGDTDPASSTVEAQDSYGDALLTTTGTLTWTTGAFAGTQAVIVDSTDLISVPVTDVFDSASGSVLILTKVPVGGTSKSVFGAGNGGTGFDKVQIGLGDPGQVRGYFGTNGGALQSLSIATPGDTGWHLIYLGWDGTATEGSIDAGTKVTGVRTAPQGATDGNVRVGSAPAGNQQWGEPIESVMTFSRTLTDAEIAAVWARTTRWTFDMVGS